LFSGDDRNSVYHFILQTIYFKLFQYNRLSKHLHFLDKKPISSHICHRIYTYCWILFCLAWEKRVAKKKSSPGSSSYNCSNCSVGAVGPCVESFISHETKAKIHYLIVQTGIVTNCLLLYSIGRLEALRTSVQWIKTNRRKTFVEEGARVLAEKFPRGNNGKNKIEK